MKKYNRAMVWIVATVVALTLGFAFSAMWPQVSP
jgi:hypothetical protein